ncbi:uncharacterized protein LOC141851435 [Brevipalpus obovatus]|uniref:uncharacterized protein LOC141851435 n=1 Tax=Brevipalpus obovatus TaxID=246614 RepID=UPI003D9DE1F8
MLQRIDLCCKTIAPSVIGYLMELSNLFSVLFLLFWNVVSVFFEYLVLKSIFDKRKDKLLTPKPESSTELEFFDIDEFKEYYQNFFLPGTAFALLFLTVIGFDYESESIPGYLCHKGINEGAIGLINLAGAVFGIMGTFIFKFLSTKMSLERVGLFGLTTNALLSFLCIAEVWNTSEKNALIGINLNLSLFLAGLLATRPGLWIADLAVNQMIQIDTPCPATIGSVQINLNLSAELIKFIILALMPRFDQFTILIAMSLIPATLAAILFSVYALRHQSTLSIGLISSSSLTLPTLHPRSQTGCILRGGMKLETLNDEPLKKINSKIEL